MAVRKKEATSTTQQQLRTEEEEKNPVIKANLLPPPSKASLASKQGFFSSGIQRMLAAPAPRGHHRQNEDFLTVSCCALYTYRYSKAVFLRSCVYVCLWLLRTNAPPILPLPRSGMGFWKAAAAAAPTLNARGGREGGIPVIWCSYRGRRKKEEATEEGGGPLGVATAPGLHRNSGPRICTYDEKDASNPEASFFPVGGKAFLL